MTLEEKIRLIAQEFSGKEHSPKTDEKLQRLEQRRITPNSLIPKRRFLFEMFDKPCFARGELVGITGRAKSGKTFFTSVMQEGEKLRAYELQKRVMDRYKYITLNTYLYIKDMAQRIGLLCKTVVNPRCVYYSLQPTLTATLSATTPDATSNGQAILPP